MAEAHDGGYLCLDAVTWPLSAESTDEAVYLWVVELAAECMLHMEDEAEDNDDADDTDDKC